MRMSVAAANLSDHLSIPSDVKTIAALSDIHGNILALEKIVADIGRRQVDIVVNLGDHLSGPLWPKETIQFLMQQEWIHISGNHDRQLVDRDPRSHGPSDEYAFKVLNDSEKEWVRSLPPRVNVDEHVLLFHGTPFSDSEYLLETIDNGRAVLASPGDIRKKLGGMKSSIMLCGHTHVQRVVSIEEEIMIVNPGSVGLPAYEAHSPEPHVIETGSPHARYALLTYDTSLTVEFVSVPYDFQRATEQAIKNKRHDWAIALETGFMRA